MQDKILNRLKESKGYVSGAQLGAELGVSRAAIWKSIKSLREAGYEIEAVNNRGYCIHIDNELFNQREISHGIHTNKMGQAVFFYETVDSTNLCARRLAEQGEAEGSLAVAEMQTAGRGRLGRQWLAPAGTGIWMSLLLRPAMEPKNAPVLTLLAGLAVCKAIRRSTGLLAEIKWPNDVCVNGKKVCGILTEMDGEMECIRSVVVGMGINVNTLSFPKELAEKATSLKIEAGQTILRIPLLSAVMEEFEVAYQQFSQDWDFMPLLLEYKSACGTLGKEIQVIGRHSFFGKALDITPFGELVVKKENGEEIIVYSGEVSVRSEEGRYL